MKILNMCGVLAALLITSLQAAAQPEPEKFGLTLPVRWELPQRPLYNQPTGQSSQPLKPVRKRNKLAIALGAAGIGGGVAMMLWGPVSTSQSAYTTSTNVKAAGAVFAGFGGVALVIGLRGK